MEYKLIELVKTNAFLYDRSLPQYKNVQLKEEKWKEIAARLKTNVTAVKTRWKTLRDKCRRQEKENKTTHWKYTAHMQFYNAYHSTVKVKSYNDPDEDLFEYKNVQMEPINFYSTESGELSFCNSNDKETDDRNQNDSIDTTDKSGPMMSLYIEPVKPQKQLEHHNGVRNYKNSEENHVKNTCDEIVNLLKTKIATKTTGENRAVRAFFHALALQVEEENLPFDRIANLQMRLLQVMTEEINDYKMTCNG